MTLRAIALGVGFGLLGLGAVLGVVTVLALGSWLSLFLLERVLKHRYVYPEFVRFVAARRRWRMRVDDRDDLDDYDAAEQAAFRPALSQLHQLHKLRPELSLCELVLEVSRYRDATAGGQFKSLARIDDREFTESARDYRWSLEGGA